MAVTYTLHLLGEPLLPLRKEMLTQALSTTLVLEKDVGCALVDSFNPKE